MTEQIKVTKCTRKHWCATEHARLWDNAPEPCQVCDLSAERKAASDAGKVLAFYVIAVCVSRHYGGPEEGGWWYDIRRILEVRKVFTVLQGIRAAKDLIDAYPSGRRDTVDISVVYDDTDPRWPSETTEIPRYE